MKVKLTCGIVQDILPNYIEKLTSDETNLAIEEHLHSCKECKQVYEQMIADINKPVKIPVKELKFLRKIRKTRVLS